MCYETVIKQANSYAECISVYTVNIYWLYLHLKCMNITYHLYQLSAGKWGNIFKYFIKNMCTCHKSTNLLHVHDRLWCLIIY